MIDSEKREEEEEEGGADINSHPPK